MPITLHRLHADHGTIVQFEGTDEDGDTVIVSCDHRPAQDILNALQDGEEVVVDPEPWAVQRG